MAKKSRSYSNKSLKQSKKSARGRTGRKFIAPAGRGRLGGGGPNPHPPDKPTPTSAPESYPAPGSREDILLNEKGSMFESDERKTLNL